jgi:hypothetical protein
MKDREIARFLTRLLGAHLDGASHDATVKGLRKLALEIEKVPALAAPPTAAQEYQAGWERIWSHWQRAMAMPKARPTPERKARVMARLRDGYTEAQIKAAITACASSPWHMGKNDQSRAYNDLELICRNGAKLEGFLAQATEGGGDQTENPELAKLHRNLARAMKEGNADDIAAANHAVRAAKSATGRAGP